MNEREKEYLEKSVKAFLVELMNRFDLANVNISLEYVHIDENGKEVNNLKMEYVK